MAELIDPTNHERLDQVIQSWKRQSIDVRQTFHHYYDGTLEKEPFKFFLTSVTSETTTYRHTKVKKCSQFKNINATEVICMFGLARALESGPFDESIPVCCVVYDYIPYVYAIPIAKIIANSDGFLTFCHDFEEFLNTNVKQLARSMLEIQEFSEIFSENEQCGVFIKVDPLSHDKVVKLARCFEPAKRDPDHGVMKINVCVSRLIPVISKLLWKKTFQLQGTAEFEVWLYEEGVSNYVKFMTDEAIAANNWVGVKPGKYSVREGVPSEDIPKISHCLIELDVHVADLLKSHQLPSDPWIPPVRVLCFDIESRVKTSNRNQVILNSAKSTNDNKHGTIETKTKPNAHYSKKRTYKEANDKSPPSSQDVLIGEQPVIQIGVELRVFSVRGHRLVGKVVFAIGSINPSPETTIYEVLGENGQSSDPTIIPLTIEGNLLDKFKEVMILSDPDLYTGFCIKNYDIPHMIKRAEIIANKYPSNAAVNFTYLGRLKNKRTTVSKKLSEEEKSFRYDQYGFTISGRCCFDMYPIVRLHEAYRIGQKLGLMDFSNRYLDTSKRKIDLPIDQINIHQDSNMISRKLLAEYCARDCSAPLDLMVVRLPKLPVDMHVFQFYILESQGSSVLMEDLASKATKFQAAFKHRMLGRHNGRVTLNPFKFK